MTDQTIREQIAQLFWKFKNQSKINDSAFPYVDELIEVLSKGDAPELTGEDFRNAVSEVWDKHDELSDKEFWESFCNAIYQATRALLIPWANARVEQVKKETAEELGDYLGIYENVWK